MTGSLFHSSRTESWFRGLVSHLPVINILLIRDGSCSCANGLLTDAWVPDWVLVVKRINTTQVYWIVIRFRQIYGER